MVERSLAEATEAMSGRMLAGDPDARFGGAAIDSRATRPGNLFFALEGERTDGHRYTADALSRGAAGVVVHHDPESAEPGAWLRVDDTFRALHDLTRHVRTEVPKRLVAITGSVGKTTTKDLLAAMLATRFRTAKSPGNLNNLYGFPVSLLTIPEDCQWMVAEMGMSTPGELRAISLLGRPDVAILTNVRAAHLASFGDLDAIADAKAELLAGVPADGLLVINAEDERLVRLAARYAGKVVRFGRLGTADLDLALGDLAQRSDGQIGTVFTLRAKSGQAVSVTLPLHGLYNAENCLAAAACAHALGIGLQAVAEAVSEVVPGAMRGVVERLANGLLLIDDCYNANPTAVERALESAALLPAARRVAVLGDMLELGPGEQVFHREIGAAAVRAGFDEVVGVGERSRALVDTVEDARTASRWFPDAAAAARWAGSDQAPGRGDLLLVKGSRGVGLEAVTGAVRERARGGRR